MGDEWESDDRPVSQSSAFGQTAVVRMYCCAAVRPTFYYPRDAMLVQVLDRGLCLCVFFCLYVTACVCVFVCLSIIHHCHVKMANLG